MSDKNMIALAEIRNGYALNKYGNLTLEQISLIKYDDLCLSLIKENQELKKQLEEYKEEKQEWINLLDMFKNQQKEFIDYLENEIYSIEPKGTGVNYNCEYDSEEDYIKGMKEQSKLNTFKEILSKYKKIIGGNDE